MKIIRHSRKMFVYSLSILLSAQQISCMQSQQRTAPAAHPDQKSISELSAMLRGHNNVDDVIDTMQIAIGGIDDQDGTSHHIFSITRPALGGRPQETVQHTQDELALELKNIQIQRQKYDGAFWFNWSEYWKKDYNKQLVRSNLIAITTLAYAKRCENFTPDTSIIDNLPKKAQDIDSMQIITHLQNGFATIDPEKTCLSMKVKDILIKLTSQFHFFDNPSVCCWFSSEQRAKRLEYNIDLRTNIIPYSYFLERQRRIKALQIPKQMASAADQAQQQQRDAQPPHAPVYNPYAGAPVVIIGGHQPPPPPYHAASYPRQQFADPFAQGSESGLTN